MSDLFDAKTLDYYSGDAESYLASRPDNVSRHLHEFLERLAPGACILELGCGAGRDSKAMIAAGFDVDPTDGVTEIAAIAAERLQRDVRLMRFDELDASNEYDAVWANASLHHVPRSQLPPVLQSVFQALKPGGLHFANYKRGTVDSRDAKDRHYTHLTLESLRGLYSGSADWEIVTCHAYEGGDGYEGSNSPWVAITVCKPG
ncbi:MAG: class I SAM-dependent methyltransferase [Rhodobiaceae bacterium]|nr:class I SAM-dependent methyltransferase [Rhodobiaceae bacterium]